jgi:hypothetical protein
MQGGFLGSCLIAVLTAHVSFATSVSFTVSQRPVSASEATHGYSVWRANFNKPAGRGSFADHAVPEPVTWLFMVGAATLHTLRRRFH